MNGHDFWPGFLSQHDNLIRSPADDICFLEQSLAPDAVNSALKWCCSLITNDAVGSVDFKFLRDGNVVLNSSIAERSGLTLSPHDVFDFLCDHSTFVINHIESFDSRLSDRFSEFACECGTLFHVNMYWTPPRSFGAARHHDPHDVIIVQLYGSKEWTVEEDGVDRTHVLKAGDLLYLSKGVVHDPRCLDESSIHLTIGLDRTAGREQMQRALANFESSVELSIEAGAVENVPLAVDYVLGARREKTLILPDGHFLIVRNSTVLLQTDNSQYVLMEMDRHTGFSERKMNVEDFVSVEFLDRPVILSILVRLIISDCLRVV